MPMSQRPARPAEDVARGLLRAALAGRASAVEEDLDGDGAHQRVDDAAPERADAFEAAVSTLASVPERRTNEPPERVPAEPDCESREQHVAKRVLLDCAKRALLVCDLAAVPDGEVEGEQPDDPVDERAGDEAGP
jgi:hypothetical protein